MEEDYPITSGILAKLFAEIVDRDDDLPENYTAGYIAGFLDAMLRARKTYTRAGCRR